MLEALETLILEDEPDLTVITDTWLDNNISDVEVTPPEYNTVRKDRSGRGAGIAILIKQNIAFLITPVPSNIETVWIKANLSNRGVFIGDAYRAPNTTTEQILSLRKFMDSKFKQDDNIVLLDDFNRPDSDGNDYLPGKTDVESSDNFLELIFC